MKHMLMICCLALSLTACKDEEAAAVVPDETDGCGAAPLQHLVGQGRDALVDMEAGPKLRIIGPGMAVTMDYRFDRLNIELDEDDQVVRVYCG